VLDEFRAFLATPTRLRVQVVAGIALAAAAGWYVVFSRVVAPLWGPGANTFAVVHLSGAMLLTYAGLVTWARRPVSSIGPLLLAAAFSSHLAALQFYPYQRQFVESWSVIDLANWFGGLPTLILLHAAMSFPAGRCPGRVERTIAWSLYAGLVVAGWMLPTPLFRWVTIPSTVMIFGAAVAVAVRYLRASPAGRRVLGPVPILVALITFVGVVFGTVKGLEDRSEAAMRMAQYALVMTNPLVGTAFMVSLLRTRLASAGVGELVLRLQERPGAAGLVDALRRAVNDPSLEVGFWLPERSAYVTNTGHVITEESLPPHRLVSPVRDAEGKPLAVLIHDAALAEEDELIHAITAATHFALENARLQAELELRLQEVQASRVRIVAAADSERRKVERDLHDGAQQRLVALSLRLQEARTKAGDTGLGAMLEEVSAELQQGLRELRELARGIHPVVLTQQGLQEALLSLAGRAPVPIEVDAPPDRYAPAVEATAYFVAAEGITNIVKHAQASHASLKVEAANGWLVLELVDNGVGGARATSGSGLEGLTDRVAALQGTLTIQRATGGGTRLCARLPLDPAASGVREAPAGPAKNRG
jgi:signal transduction histidine kinase